jgi:hypothetical protein
VHERRKTMLMSGPGVKIELSTSTGQTTQLEAKITKKTMPQETPPKLLRFAHKNQRKTAKTKT